MTSTGCHTATRRTSGTTRRSSSSSPALCTGAPRRSSVVQPGRVVQLFSALCVIGIAALTFAPRARALPGPAWLAPLALLLAVFTPVLVRAGSLFHPEPLATLLTTAALYVVVRAMRRERLGWGAGLLAGGLLGLANLTRTWALAALAAVLLGLALHWLWRRDAAGAAGARRRRGRRPRC